MTSADFAEQLRRFNDIRSRVIRTVDELRHETPYETNERLRREQEIAESLEGGEYGVTGT